MGASIAAIKAVSGRLTLGLILACLSMITVTTSYAQETENTTNTPEETPEGEDNKNNISSRARFRSPASSHSQMQLLADAMPESAVNWVETDAEPFFALWYRDRSGDAKGAILILHAEGESPAWPQTTNPLHNTLPDYGWATMALHLSDPEKAVIPKRTINKPIDENTEDEPPDTGNTETPKEESHSDKQTEAIATNRLNYALKFLHNKGQYNIVIMGSGAGAIRAHRFLKEITPKITDEALKDRFEKPIRALILYNARNRLPQQENEYREWFADPDIPVLDIYNSTDSRNSKSAKYRAILAKQSNAKAYRQVRINDMNYETAWGENRLSRRIRSFLDAYLQGVEIAKGPAEK